jgi:signal transduction histidine kinase
MAIRSKGPALRLRPLAFTVFAMVAVLGSVAGAFHMVELSAERVFLDRERDDALSQRQIFREAFAQEGGGGLALRMERLTRLAPPDAHYGLFDRDGRRVAGDLLGRPSPLAEGGWVEARSQTREGPVDLHVTTATLPDGSLLVLGRGAAGQRAFEARIGDGLLMALAIVVVASLGVGLLLNALVIQRASGVAGVAERIAAADLQARAEVSERGDAFDRIGASLNRMLDRIAEILTGMRAVTDSLAHDMPSTLSRVRLRAVDALDPTKSHADCREALEFVSEELARALSDFAALVDIARAESGLSREMMQPLRLDELALDMAGLFAPVLEDAGQRLETRPTGALVVEGHEQLLRQAVGNLLFNAAKYAGSGASVILEVLNSDGGAEIILADNGPGIPAEHRGRVTDRFVRLDDVPGRPGSGLGLSIVAAAAKLHGGELRLEDNGPGLRAVLSLARTPAVAPEAATAFSAQGSRSTTPSIRNATSSAQTSAANDAQAPWRVGARAWARAGPGFGEMRPARDGLPFG